MFARKTSDAAKGTYALGLASIGIGLTELLAPRQVENMLGIKGCQKQRGILKVLGVRELLHGAGILATKPGTGKLTTGAWARVAGDALDSALLGIAATKTQRPGRFAVVALAVTGIGAADMYYAFKTTGHELAEASRFKLPKFRS